MTRSRLHVFGVGPQEQRHTRLSRQDERLPVVLQLPWKLDHIGGAIGDDAGEPIEIRTTAVHVCCSNGSSAEVEEPESQLGAGAAAQGALAHTGRPEQEDDRA